MLLEGIIIFLALSTFTVGTYIVWPSRFNVINHFKIGFCFTAFLIPAVILQLFKTESEEVITFYVSLLGWGALAYIIGMFAGFSLPRIKLPFSFSLLPTAIYERRVTNISTKALIVACVCMIISFGVMGFIPFFASDPIAAKFFKGEYHDRYMRVAVLYRFSFFIITVIIPIALIVWYKTKKFKYLLLSAASISILFLTLSRGPAFTGIILAVGLVLSVRSKKGFVLFIFLNIITYVIGALLYLIVGVMSPETLSFIDPSSGSVFWQLVAAGNPDMMDTLHFLEKFLDHPVWTYGRTFYGGLIPNHYEWAPTTYVFRVLDPNADINDINSGGFRLPIPVWGYVAFGWAGNLITCGLSGFLAGYFTKIYKYWMLTNSSLIVQIICTMTATYLFGFFTNFYSLYIYDLPPLFVLMFFLFRIKVK